MFELDTDFSAKTEKISTRPEPINQNFSENKSKRSSPFWSAVEERFLKRILDFRTISF